MIDPGRPVNRGQTTYDFAIGVSVFLLAAVFVITFVPNVTAPYGEGITEAEQEHAHAIARSLVADFSDTGSPAALNETRTTAFFTTTWNSDGLQNRFGVQQTTRINVTLQGVEEDSDSLTICESTCAAGDVFREQGAAVSVRVVNLDGEPYRLEVRVW